MDVPELLFPVVLLSSVLLSEAELSGGSVVVTVGMTVVVVDTTGGTGIFVVEEPIDELEVELCEAEVKIEPVVDFSVVVTGGTGGTSVLGSELELGDVGPVVVLSV